MLATPTRPSLNALVAHAQTVARMGWAKILAAPAVSAVLQRQLELLCERTTGVQTLVDAWQQTAHQGDQGDVEARAAASRDLARSIARELGGGALFVEAIRSAARDMNEEEGETLRGWARDFARTKGEIAGQLDSLVGRRVVGLGAAMSIDEAMQVASEAVLKAVDYFSPAHGADFTWYALRCVGRALTASREPEAGAVAAPDEPTNRDASTPGPGAQAPRPFDVAYERVDWAVSALAPLEVSLLRRRYGLGGEEERSLSGLCREFEMPRRQVLRILNDAQAKVARLLAAAGCFEPEAEVKAFVPVTMPSQFPRRACRRSA